MNYPEVSFSRRNRGRVLKFASIYDSTHGFTLVELLVVIAIISTLAGFLIPTIQQGLIAVKKVECQNHLKQIASLAITFTDTGNQRFFPLGKGSNPPAHESLNELIKEFDDLLPEMFICPEYRGDKAEVDEEGKFVLSEETCFYAWISTKLSPSDGIRPPRVRQVYQVQEPVVWP